MTWPRQLGDLAALQADQRRLMNINKALGAIPWYTFNICTRGDPGFEAIG